jgi:hypothetical protein
MQCWVSAVGAIGPGVAEWARLARVLRGDAPFAPGSTALPKLEILPPVERRRTGLPVKLALAAGLQALAAAGVGADRVATVFTSSGGDGEVLHDICTMLASGDHQISPTKFHNSVHNAPSGYWSIATQSRQPSTSLCGYDWSFAAGLVEAATQAAVDYEQVLLVSYDEPYPAPLSATRAIEGALGVALLLTRERPTESLGRLSLALEMQQAPEPLPDAALERLRAGNPTGRSLPLLRVLALGSAQTVPIDYLGGSLCVAVSPA